MNTNTYFCTSNFFCNYFCKIFCKRAKCNKEGLKQHGQESPFWGGDIWAKYWKSGSISHVEFQERRGGEDQYIWPESALILIRHPNAFALESVKRSVFLTSDWVNGKFDFLCHLLRFEVTIIFLPSFDAKYSGSLLLGPRNGFVSFAVIFLGGGP